MALPVEHGGWGLLLEPLVLGFVLAPSTAGAWLALAAIASFLARHPLKLVLADRRRGARYPRTVLAERFAFTYASVSVLTLTVACVQAGRSFLWPLVAASPLALAQLRYDAHNKGRSLVPQLLGAVALGSLASAMGKTGGWEWNVALALWAIVGARGVASVLYVRARLRLERGQQEGRMAALWSHGLALAVVSGLALAGVAPWLAVAAFAVLWIRAAWGLSRLHWAARPQAIGLAELAFGVLTVMVVAAGYALEL